MNNKTPKRRVGDIGEQVAAKYLEKKGFLIVAANYLKPWGELDIVATKADKMHFIEVKTVSRGKWWGSDQARPEENMHVRKVRRLNRAIQTYLLERKVPKKVEWQIDLVCVYLDFSTRRATVERFENIIL
ncbi:MAG TPA: YraN family protein [Candidatus Paceibacterota bacterium]|nr:YraN family protein [Candidatus Paceibacterota bacterium]